MKRKHKERKISLQLQCGVTRTLSKAHASGACMHSHLCNLFGVRALDVSECNNVGGLLRNTRRVVPLLKSYSCRVLSIKLVAYSGTE
jgi:hypothetical protein